MNTVTSGPHGNDSLGLHCSTASTIVQRMVENKYLFKTPLEPRYFYYINKMGEGWVRIDASLTPHRSQLFSEETNCLSGKIAFTTVVFPDCLGPIINTTGNSQSGRKI